MKGITVSDQLVEDVCSLFTSTKKAKSVEEAKTTEKISESEEAGAGEHKCPLCESNLEESITEEQMQKHVDMLMEAINENFEFVEDESLDEVENEDEDSEEDTKEGK